MSYWTLEPQDPSDIRKVTRAPKFYFDARTSLGSEIARQRLAKILPKVQEEVGVPLKLVSYK